MLYYYGWLAYLGALLAIIQYQQGEPVIIMGVNGWLKPIKFFASVGIFCWTMSWIGHYLKDQRKVRAYSRMVVVVMTLELFIISWQAANGRLSHFNTSTPFYNALYMIMGIAIITLTAWTGYLAWLFFRQGAYSPMSSPYLWGIRMGLIGFVVFAFEGGLMSGLMTHSIGGPDGSPGIPFFNWSQYVGDLRVAHFFGIHALQVLPLTGRYLASSKKQMLLFSIVYFALVVVYLVQALLGIPSF